MIDLNVVGYGNGLIYVGIPRERIYLTPFVDNRDALLTELAKTGRSCGYWQAEGHRVDRNRDRICEEFLKHEKQPEWLFMIDTDMEHPTDAPIRLTSWKKPVVGALYFHRGDSHDPFIFDFIGTRKDKFGRDTFSWSPKADLVYEYLESQNIPMRDGGLTINNPTKNPLIECDAVATGCMVIHRSVLEAMPPPWFEYRVGGNSEDLMFCKEVKETLNIPIYCDMSTICGHFHWVAMGQAQFRMKYLNRGINFTSYTLGMAARWWAKYFNCPPEEAIELVKKGTASEVGKVWRERFNGKVPKPEEVDAFYRDPEVGKSYIMELLHWNFSVNFNLLRKVLVSIKNSNVLEIGSGIGSVALQLWLQRNNVLASEVNPILRDFTDIRYQEMVEEATYGEVGQISVIDDTWMEKTPNETQDFVISFDTFEHLPAEILEKTLAAAWDKLKMGGRLIYHANFAQQDLYPMHFDHSKIFEKMLVGYDRISEMELKKVKK